MKENKTIHFSFEEMKNGTMRKLWKSSGMLHGGMATCDDMKRKNC